MSTADPNPPDDDARSHEAVIRGIRARLLPRFGADLARNLLYTVGFMRVSGQREGAAAVDRDGTGKVYRAADRRADDTVLHFDDWMAWGASSAPAVASIERVRRIHDGYATRYAMSQETYVHTVAYFTMQFDILFRLVGATPFTEDERAAQVAHWRAIGAVLGVVEMPETWEGMDAAMRAYESDDEWFGYTPAARRSSDALIDQFSARWLPRGTRWAGRSILCSLQAPHVLDALGQPHPPAVTAAVVRFIVRCGLTIPRYLPARSETDVASASHR